MKGVERKCQAGVERANGERDGASCHHKESDSFLYSSGYSTEPRGMKLMCDTSRMITFLQTRIGVIMCEGRSHV